jgi:hypothetical protein
VLTGCNTKKSNGTTGLHTPSTTLLSFIWVATANILATFRPARPQTSSPRICGHVSLLTASDGRGIRKFLRRW